MPCIVRLHSLWNNNKKKICSSPMLRKDIFQWFLPVLAKGKARDLVNVEDRLSLHWWLLLSTCDSLSWWSASPPCIPKHHQNPLHLSLPHWGWVSAAMTLPLVSWTVLFLSKAKKVLGTVKLEKRYRMQWTRWSHHGKESPARCRGSRRRMC